MDKLTARFEYVAVAALMLMLMLTVGYGMIIVAWSLVVDLSGPHELIGEPKALFDVFGLFVAILVGIELLKIMRHFLVAHDVDTALVVQTALIALCNKIITMNVSAASWTTLVALAALTLALAAAVFALRRNAGGA
ncbi:MAG TPA: phosphate-starvation-inducible PsiE family protein [Burkholderiaceae bacterium]|nr:phosphate-starvation-inducible PsiE family protein [Burkholderiaceae bacterium]